MVFRAVDESLSGKGEGSFAIHQLATIKYLGRRGCIRLEIYSLGVGHPVELRRHTIAVLCRRTIPYRGSRMPMLN
jgi:hypothetical protein